MPKMKTSLVICLHAGDLNWWTWLLHKVTRLYAVTCSNSSSCYFSCGGYLQPTPGETWSESFDIYRWTAENRRFQSELRDFNVKIVSGWKTSRFWCFGYCKSTLYARAFLQALIHEFYKLRAAQAHGFKVPSVFEEKDVIELLARLFSLCSFRVICLFYS